ncbi:site-specific DNA-methyltransferase [Vibrio parahaemolyticus]|uniref:site-specific DNA-methyltransferase n=1 Tax=Gammaproteobacteria TaxID=1236 RepID=UPI001123E84B|nr:site-specific DNA-methyltransferase [Vibrio parahaemolyticus]MCZ5869522.1 site-specific DNA-methyltransferase [Vibrio parahaemolyticus]MCZ5899893.1 site-specific DNA-methyltransferase [Vibrio parahaemolyticus]MCZ6308180.1 site-specific DNA-methyltransferase [Vibrio parahaemolyticus]MDL2009405.1 site-specific DNA-methyltransferase [Vibrio parahaemolyticus]TOE77804.1 type III restriction endonuclease subunit M [Vibrio parahaemolyticus]
MNIKEEIVYSNVETANSKQLAILKKHFPQCFDKQGNFIQEKLLEVVKSSDVELSKESYSLNWLGKSYARLLTNLPPKTLLHEDKQHNHLEANKDSQNLLIKGDNLEVLKHMVNAYSEKVKMIYIDPPYNTGSDGFVYNDDRKFTPQQLSELAGIDLDEATRILDFTAKGSSSHSAWLTFMYPRLYIARELLREDGAIFISIDDNEVSQLKLICDEVFGEANFVANVIWHKRYAASNDAKGIPAMHDHILVYQRTSSFNRNLLPRTEKQNSLYKYDSNDGKGLWRSDNLTVKTVSEEYLYEIINPKTGKAYTPTQGRCWLTNKTKMAEWIEEGRVFFGMKGDGAPQLKRYLSEVQDGVIPNTYWSYEDVGHTDSARKELKKLFESSAPFDNPKPTGLLIKAFQIASDKNDIILDFFAGSGTSAEAVYKLNVSDSGNRKFIVIQIPEKTSIKSEARKAGYETIFEITKDRLLKASEKIRAENPDYQGDLGFKIFETVEDFRVKDEGELTLENHSFFDDAVLTDKQYNTLLTTWCVYDGSLLTTPIQDVDLNGYTVHLCDKRLYLIAPNFNSETIKALLHELDNNKEFEPNKVVFYGNNFDSAKQMELNEALKGYANKKSLEIDLVVRN